MRESFRQFAQLIKDVLQGPVPEGADSFDESVLESDRRPDLWVIGSSQLFGGFGCGPPWHLLRALLEGRERFGLMVIANRYSTTRGVSAIFVASGDYVTAGHPLIQLDITQAQAEQRIVEGRAWAKQRELPGWSERDGNSNLASLQSY